MTIIVVTIITREKYSSKLRAKRIVVTSVYYAREKNSRNYILNDNNRCFASQNNSNNASHFA